MKRFIKFGVAAFVAGFLGVLIWVGMQPVMQLTALAEGQTAVRSRVHAADAAYPLTKDPLIFTPESDWTSFTPQDANYGYAVASAGDVNGDGYDDVIVGANWYDNGQVDEGAAFVFLGSPTGLNPLFAWRYESDTANEEFGIAVSTAGDVNGDGYDDVLIGANSPLASSMGKAYVFYGSPTGLAAAPAWIAAGEQIADKFGTAVASAGDVNNDTYDDIIIGAPEYNGASGVPLSGRAYVYYGSAAGLSTTADWVAESDLDGSRFGISVNSAGDVNNDTFADVIIGAPDYAPNGVTTGLTAVYLGGQNGLPAAMPPIATLSDASSVLIGEIPFGTPHQFGFAAAAAGDVNGDGLGDVIVGAPGYGDQFGVYGAAFVYFGTPQGEVLTPTMVSAYIPDAMFGHDVGSAGDMNGDGYDEVIAGAPGYNAGIQGSRPALIGGGGAFVYQGTSAISELFPLWYGASQTADARYGTSVAAGDVNGDGFGDVLVGAPQLPNPSGFKGQAFAYYGSGVISALTAVNSSPTPLGQPTFFQALAPGAGFLHYEWAFGDGGTAVGQTPGHVYAEPGLYTALVTATSLTDMAYATTPVTVTVDSTVTPDGGGDLTFTNPTTGLGLNVHVPAGAVSDLLQLSYTPLVTISQPSPAGTIGYYFDLNAVDGKKVYLPLIPVGDAPIVVGEPQAVAGETAVPLLPSPAAPTPGFTFLQPVSIKIFYNEATLPPGTDETAMKLTFWDKPSQLWIDAATTCVPASTYEYNPVENWFRVDICHLSRFSVSG
ncbi:MAG: FG-GAP repeat protein [Chloroflexi bacterium]|nr:FG-GAP repeat protein [Chloroflexota bacterium]